MVLPMTTSDNERIKILSAENAITAMVDKPMTEIPAASPSRPSIKLMAFVIPTIHNTVRDMPSSLTQFDLLRKEQRKSPFLSLCLQSDKQQELVREI